jgi:hypothetical protein
VLSWGVLLLGIGKDDEFRETVGLEEKNRDPDLAMPLILPIGGTVNKGSFFVSAKNREVG